MGKKIIIHESMLKSIISEELLLEITADDAYRKFYSSMPREDFDRILNGETKPDKFLQFFLSAVRDGECDVDTACQTIEGVKNADNLVKQKIKNKFGAGEYKTVSAIADDLYYFSNGGTILSAKSFAKQCYDVIAQNERWIVTCTKSWMANNAYFGKLGARWCTASDRNGNYDGYKMFRSYTDDAVLIQYRWKGKIKKFDKGNDGWYTYKNNYPQECFDDDEGFIGDELNERDSLFQLAVGRIAKQGDKPYIRDCENILNKSCGGYNGVAEYVGKDLISLLNNKELIDRLCEETKNAKAQEDEYVNIEEKRKKEILERSRKIAEKESERLNKILVNEVMEKWNNFLNNKEYESINAENGVSDFGFIKLISYANFGNRKLLALCPFVKQGYSPLLIPDGKKYEATKSRFHAITIRDKTIVILSDESVGKSILIGEYDGYRSVCLNSVYSVSSTQSERFVIITGFVGGNGNENEIGLGIFFDMNNMFMTELDESMYDFVYGVSDDTDFYNTFDDGTILFSANKGEDYFFYDENAKSIKYGPINGINFIFSNEYDAEDSKFILSYGNKQYLAFQGKMHEMNLPKMVTGLQSDYFDYDIGETLFQLKFSDGTFNIYSLERNELIFGVFGEVATTSACVCFKKNGKTNYILVDYNRSGDGKIAYQLARSGSINTECDKYGRTEEDINLEKNMKAYQNGVGADNGQDWGRAAMTYDMDKRPLSDAEMKARGWLFSGVDDIWFKSKPGVDMFGLINQYDWSKIKNLPKEQQDKITKELWNRAYNEGYIVIGDRYGNTHEWDERNEIPAKLSDRPINEGIYKMKSIWNRMGLND